MKTRSVTTMMLGFILTLTASGSFAQAISPYEIEFYGDIISGPFSGQTVSGTCLLDAAGDPNLQKTVCNLSLRSSEMQREGKSGIDVTDHEATLEVVSDGNAIRMSIGPVMNSDSKGGGDKMPLFAAVTVHNSPVNLLAFPEEYNTVMLSLFGLSVPVDPMPVTGGTINVYFHVIRKGTGINPN